MLEGSDQLSAVSRQRSAARNACWPMPDARCPMLEGSDQLSAVSYRLSAIGSPQRLLADAR
jgi:hypothetical protein